MAETEARFLSSDEWEQWDELVASSPSGSLFDESVWLTALAETLARDVRIVGVFEKDALIGGVVVSCGSQLLMPVAREPQPTFVNSCQFRPTDRKTRSAATKRGLAVSDAVADFLMARFSRVLITNHPAFVDVRSFRWRGWQTNILYTYQIDLATLDLMNLHGRRRNQIRSAEKAGLVVEEGADFSAAHDLMFKTYERQGVALDISEDDFATVCQRLGDKVTVYSAKAPDSTKPAAMLLTLLDTDRGAGYIMFAGFDREQAKTHATSFLYWQHLLALKERGFKMVDVIGADVRPNADFKADFEGELVPYFQVAYASFPFRLVNFLLRRGG